MHDLSTLIVDRLISGLKRKSITSASQWACEYRVMAGDHPGKWNFTYHPWLKDMHDSDAELNVGMKAAQMGFSETMLNVAFHLIDVLGRDCLYVLPNKTPGASNFSAARFDGALELSPHLAKLFSDVRNVGHKRAGAANLYIRGSQSKSGLKEVPVSLIILDEVAEMVQAHIPLALERLSGQIKKKAWMVSTPTIPNKNIHMYYQRSTEERFIFNCPACSRHTELSFPESLVITAESLTDQKIKDSHIICKECKHKLDHETKHIWLKDAKWVPSYIDRDIKGYGISQFYSSAIKPVDLAMSYLRGLSNPADETEFFNSKLGQVHVVEGAKITDGNIDACRGTHTNEDAPPYPALITMGIDVGSWLHYEIDQWFLKGYSGADANVLALCKVVRFGKVRSFGEIDALMRHYRVISAVIDANPERRMASEFASRFYGMVKMCFYARGIDGKQIHVGNDEKDPTIKVDRTSWLDLSLSRFKNKTINLPLNIDLEYREHIKALVRVYNKDKDGNPVGSYDKGDNDPDHYAHARNYSEIALPFALARGQSQTIKTGIF